MIITGHFITRRKEYVKSIVFAEKENKKQQPDKGVRMRILSKSLKIFV